MHNKMLEKVSQRLDKGWMKDDMGNPLSDDEPVCLAGAFCWALRDTHLSGHSLAQVAEFRALDRWLLNQYGLTAVNYNDHNKTTLEDIQLRIKEFDVWLIDNPKALEERKRTSRR